MDGIFYFDAFFDEQFFELVAGMLCLGYGQAVTRDDHDLMGIGEEHRRVPLTAISR